MRYLTNHFPSGVSNDVTPETPPVAARVRPNEGTDDEAIVTGSGIAASEQRLSWEPEDDDDEQNPYSADATSLKRFLEDEVVPW